MVHHSIRSPDVRRGDRRRRPARRHGLLGRGARHSGRPGARTSGTTSTATPTPTPTTPGQLDHHAGAGRHGRLGRHPRLGSDEDGTLTKASLSYLSKKGNKVPVEGWLESGIGARATCSSRGSRTRSASRRRTSPASSRPRSARSRRRTLPSTTRSGPRSTRTAARWASACRSSLASTCRSSTRRPSKSTGDGHLAARAGGFVVLALRPRGALATAEVPTPGTKVHVEANLNGVPAGGGRSASRPSSRTSRSGARSSPR